MAYHDRIPLTRRQQSEADMSLSAAVARLSDRIDRQQQELTRQQRTIDTLSARLAWSQRREQTLLRRLALKRTRRRHRPDPAQSELLL